MDASVTFLLENLKQVVVNHAKLISGAEGELKALEKELEMMKGKLKDASKKQKKEEAFKAWECQIREVVYEVEDAIDACLTNMSSKNAVSKALGLTGTSLARQVKTLREGPIKKVFDPAVVHFANLNVSDARCLEEEKSLEHWREPKKTHIVGLEEETTELIDYIKKESNGLEVVSIIGMPGLGKTTFVWKVFQDPGTLYEFPVRIWVTVSATLDRKTVFLNILKEFTTPDETKSDEELATLVKERLDKGKFLIVLDDMWTPEAWDLIKPALPMHNGKCKVLITTRMSSVAENAVTTQKPYKLRFLNKKESWELLQYGVYDKLDALDRVHDKDLVKTGKVIADNCDGLPLSIVVISGIMRDKIATSRESNLILKEWEDIAGSVKDYLIEKDNHDGKLGRMAKIIELSYAGLPYDLRDCFLYMGMFPEDYLIPARELSLFWIAEGFIQPTARCSLEKSALDNLNDLIGRGLVMLKETKLNGEVKTCSVHDSIREFCKNISDKENLFREIRMNESQKIFVPPLDSIGKHRRVSIHSHIHDLFSKKIVIPTRSFLCYPKDPIPLKPADIACVNKAFTLLRVFGAKKIKFPKFPSKIPELIHLRYLTLSLAFELKILPEAVFSLWNLQTLIVETLSRTLEIKADMWKLIQLRHLKTKSSIVLTCKNPKGEGGQNLQTLSRLSPDSCTAGTFGKAKNLHTLGVHGDLNKLLLESASLVKLELLNNLKLEHDAHPNVAAEKPMLSLPEYNKFPQNLRSLTLKHTYLQWTEMSKVGNLAKLEVLKVREQAFIGNTWDVFDNSFLKLEFLFMERIDLKYWTATDHAFPKLRILSVKNCEALDEVPPVLAKTLEVLSLERVTADAVARAKEIAEKIEETKQKDTTVRKRGFKLILGVADKNATS